MIKNKITSNCAGLDFWFYWEQRGDRIYATFHAGDDNTFTQKSKEITKDQLTTILKTIRDIPVVDNRFELFDLDKVDTRQNAYLYKVNTFMPLVSSFFAED